MSARTLMVNEGLLQEMEQRIRDVREKGSGLVKAMGSQEHFSAGMNLYIEYCQSLEILLDVGKQLFAAIDLCDPEDNELLSREQEDEEQEEEEDEDGDDEESDEDEDSE